MTAIRILDVRAAQSRLAETARRLRQTHARLSARLEYRKQVAEAEEILDRLVVVDQEQLAAGLLRRNVQADDCTEAGAVHAADVLEVDDDSAGARKQIPDMVLHGFRIFHRQAAFALNDQRIPRRQGLQS